MVELAETLTLEDIEKQSNQDLVSFSLKDLSLFASGPSLDVNQGRNYRIKIVVYILHRVNDRLKLRVST